MRSYHGVVCTCVVCCRCSDVDVVGVVGNDVFTLCVLLNIPMAVGLDMSVDI